MPSAFWYSKIAMSERHKKTNAAVDFLLLPRACRKLPLHPDKSSRVFSLQKLQALECFLPCLRVFIHTCVILVIVIVVVLMIRNLYFEK